MNKVSNSNFWNQRYLENNTGWDIGESTPILQHYLESKTKILGKVCVLGCGNGYDAIELALHENDVFAVDFAEEPLKNLKKKSDAKGL